VGQAPTLMVRSASRRQVYVACVNLATMRVSNHGHGRMPYSITAWSGAVDWLRNAALLEPMMIASGIAHSVNTITIW
jgi:hypothetical protein